MKPTSLYLQQSTTPKTKHVQPYVEGPLSVFKCAFCTHEMTFKPNASIVCDLCKNSLFYKVRKPIPRLHVAR